MLQELSFAPDRRSIQNNFYHFSERPSGDSDTRGFSQHDSLTGRLDKIYRDYFTHMEPPVRRTLVDILVREVPLNHKNFKTLAAAMFTHYFMAARGEQLNPTTFNQYFNYLAQIIMGDVTGKSTEDVALIRANFKATFLRYLNHIQVSRGRK